MYARVIRNFLNVLSGILPTIEPQLLYSERLIKVASPACSSLGATLVRAQHHGGRRLNGLPAGAWIWETICTSPLFVRCQRIRYLARSPLSEYSTNFFVGQASSTA